MTERKKPKNSKKEFSGKCVSHKKQLVQKPVSKQRLHLNSRCWHFFEKTFVKISEKLPLRFPVCNFKMRFSSIKIKTEIVKSERLRADKSLFC